MNRSEDINATPTNGSLGDLIHRARLKAGYSFKGLAAQSGVAQSQISKLEHNQVKKPNPAHLAALAEPLGLTVFRLYQAAGYRTPARLTALAPELEQALWDLPRHALVKVERYITRVCEESGKDSSLDPE